MLLVLDNLAIKSNEIVLSYSDLAKLPRIARGSSGIVSKYRDNEVIKWPYGGPEEDRNHDIERRVYERLGQHARIVKVIALLPERGIVMEQLQESLHQRLQTLRENDQVASTEQMLKWSIQIAEGLQYIHSQKVLQADIGTQNLLLDRNDDLKFADFAGSSIDSEEAFVCASARAQHPRFWQHHPSVKDEIFAMASVIYELATSHKPYHDLEDHVVEGLYAAGKFPNTDDLLLGPVIQKGWQMQYENLAEVLADLHHFQKRSSGVSVSIVVISLLTGLAATKIIWTFYNRLRHR